MNLIIIHTYEIIIEVLWNLFMDRFSYFLVSRIFNFMVHIFFFVICYNNDTSAVKLEKFHYIGNQNYSLLKYCNFRS